MQHLSPTVPAPRSPLSLSSRHLLPPPTHTLSQTKIPQVKQFYTAPTAIRSLMRAGELYVKEHNRDSLRILGSVGEPINPEAWRW